MTAIAHEWIRLAPSFDAYVSQPAEAGDRRAAVIVLQEIWGVNGHIRDVADRFARLGYVALAPDVFHRTAPRFEAPYTDGSGMQHAMKLVPAEVIADLKVAHQWLHAQMLSHTDDPKIGAVGFCLGGRMSYVANATLPLKCAVSF
jgi:carboxymethylenebutenolidase